MNHTVNFVYHCTPSREPRQNTSYITDSHDNIGSSDYSDFNDNRGSGDIIIIILIVAIIVKVIVVISMIMVILLIIVAVVIVGAFPLEGVLGNFFQESLTCISITTVLQKGFQGTSTGLQNVPGVG